MIAIDPGVHCVGWAAFDDAELRRCGVLAVEKLDFFEGRRPDVAVIEIPQIYRQSKQKGDPNDLVRLSVIAGKAAYALRASEEIFVRPRQWKGQRKKKVDNPLTESLLSGKERQALEACGAIKSKRHNVVDAIGLGLWQLKRR